MLSSESLLAFVATSTLLSLTPGPDNIFVLTQSAMNGMRSGILITLGLCTGLMVHTFAMAFGVAAIIQASAFAFFLLKMFGAGYLLYLAWHAFRAKPRSLHDVDKEAFGHAKLYRHGIIMNITNPKVSLFFLAFLPQFADPAFGSITGQIFILGGVFILTTLVVFGGVAVLAGKLNSWFTHSDRGQQVLNWVAGVVFVGLAAKIATASR